MDVLINVPIAKHYSATRYLVIKGPDEARRARTVPENLMPGIANLYARRKSSWRYV